MKRLLIIDGPNINMLGFREPEVYGRTSYDELLKLLEKWADEAGVEAKHFQSNHEGDIIDRIQKAYFDGCEGIIINAAAYTHTSIAIMDAIRATGLPAVEVHISDIYNREDFRKISYVGLACEAHFIGLGLEGYKKAIEYLANKT